MMKKFEILNHFLADTLLVSIAILVLGCNECAISTHVDSKHFLQKSHRYISANLEENSHTRHLINSSIRNLESIFFASTDVHLPKQKAQRKDLKRRQKTHGNYTQNNKSFTDNIIKFSQRVPDDEPLFPRKVQPNERMHKQQQHHNAQKFRRNGLRLLHKKIHASYEGFFPPLFNVAPRSIIYVNGTCGQNGREEFCKLVDAYPRKKLSTQCGICNALSSDITKRRSIETITSTNSNSVGSFWQSPTLQYGKEFEFITINIDLKEVYQVFFIMLKSANSPRPAAWILERSLDGIVYMPWQFFGTSDADCRHRYGLPGQNGKYVFQNDSQIICTTQFSKALPLENGEVHVSLLKNRPGAAQQSAELMNFITARYIRIRFQSMHPTSKFDNSIDWLLDAKFLEKRSFYSLQQLRISARLNCHGHASQTVEVIKEPFGNSSDSEHPESVLQCVCLQNTCGKYCEKCCPLFQEAIFTKDSITQGNECKECRCNGHTEICLYDNELARVICRDCRNNTTGHNCEACLQGYFRKTGSSASQPCYPCNCSAYGGDGNCNPIDGICHCRPGFQGPRCEDCSPGYYGDNCKKCECDLRGSLNSTKCSSPCQCKSHVGGDSCDKCLSGFYNLQQNSPDGCTPCWCSGVGLTCTSAQIERLTFETINGWKVTNINRQRTAIPSLNIDTNWLTFNMCDNSEEIDSIYWLAPQGYVGNQLKSYGSQLSVYVSWTTIRGDTSGKPTTGPNIILIGHNGFKIAHGYSKFPSHLSSTVFNVTLDESNWYEISTNDYEINVIEESVSRSRFLSILASLEVLLIRGVYHTDQVETFLERAAIIYGGSDINGTSTSRVEQCECPRGYSGLSCENCDFGFIRSNDITFSPYPKGICIPCPCNGHTESCDFKNGKCGNCLHNTFGERCEHCKIGYYGNPLQGTSNDCKPCACPLLFEQNNFSPSCELKNHNFVNASSGLTTMEKPGYICTQCAPEYTGDHCEKCNDGYFGDPTIKGLKCQPCDCDGGPCDTLSGECIICKENTEGWHCDRCKMGYWGNPKMGCVSCDCHNDGASSTVCDSYNGQCICKPHFSGQKCDQCDYGYANISLKCLPCECDTKGSVDMNSCDPYNGQCQCKPGVTGLKCKKCADDYFNINLQPDVCQDCQCNIIGSISTKCHKTSGQCDCLPNVTGRRCDRCTSGYWNLTQAVGCFKCRCNLHGSHSKECNQETGQCYCKIGVTGQHCDECTENFYGFSKEGCQQCFQCDDGKICDANNGRCICPPNSYGPSCALCTVGFWGWQAYVGCRDCKCAHEGSIGQMCVPSTGQCQCREGYTGRQCDSCAPGYFGYPECRRCNCNLDGSFKSSNGLIACDSNGQCPCKRLVVGLKCDTCKQASFGISELNPEGCTRCFCFGRSTECYLSDLSWGHLRTLESRNVSIKYVTPDHRHEQELGHIVFLKIDNSVQEDGKINMNNLNLIPNSMGNILIGAYTEFKYPMYFQLHSHFNGDRTSSYGGYLHFTLLTKGFQKPFSHDILEQFPLVQLHSHRNLILDFYGNDQNQFTSNSTYKIPIHESYWKCSRNNQIIDRPFLMTVLQNIKYILIRGFVFSDVTEVILQNVYMDDAVFVQGATNNLAKSIEQCKCPQRYAGYSCQNPGPGFYRWRNNTESDAIFVDDIIGRSIHCQCNGRSKECDRENGVCLNCNQNTGGEHCELCAEGFYGDPNSVYGCQPCPCPETNRNFAKGCTVQKEELKCICKPGHTGKLCDQCKFNYFGDLQSNPESACKPCNCNLNGIKREGCDKTTGKCFCREGVIGLKCDKCIKTKYHLRKDGCRVCDNCSLLLLDYAELIGRNMECDFRDIDLTGIPAPHIKIQQYENIFDKQELQYNNIVNSIKILMNYDYNRLRKVDSVAENLSYQSRKTLSTALKRNTDINAILKNSNILYYNIAELYADILKTILMLKDYQRGEHYISLQTVFDQTHFYLQSIRQHNESVYNIRKSFQCAWEFFYRFGNASDAAYDQETNVDIFWRDLNQSNHRLSNMRLYTDQIQEMQRETDDYLEHVSNFKIYVREQYDNINKLLENISNSFISNLTSKIHLIFENMSENRNKINSSLKVMTLKTFDLNNTLSDKLKHSREVKKHWLPKAHKHANRLMERSNEYAKQFQSTRNGARIALQASSIHSNITNIIEFAKHTCLEAMKSLTMIQPTVSSTINRSLTEKAQISLQNSNVIQNQALHETERVNVLKQKLKKQENIIETIKFKIYDSGVRMNNISVSLHKRTRTSIAHKIADECWNSSTRVINEMLADLHKIKSLHKNITQLREKLSILVPDWDIKLGMAEENISLTKTNIRLASALLSNTMEEVTKRQTQFDKWNMTISNQLQGIRDKALKARHAAEGIKVSLQSNLEKKCVRSYPPTRFGLSISNNIKLIFAVPNLNRDSPLIFVKGKENSFISVELRDGHLYLIWNLGGSTASIRHPLEINAGDHKYDDNYYHVEINRTLNMGSITVRHKNNLGLLAPSQFVSGFSNVDNTRFWQIREESVYLGQYSQETLLKGFQYTNGLNVIIHKVEVDGRSIGIWNFLTSNGDCGGAVDGALESTFSSGIYHFNGLGYAVIKKTRARPYRKNLFSLQMSFKTLDENALIFLAIDDNNNRSVSITLYEGLVSFRIDYGNNSKLEIQTSERHNTGEWTQIEVAREFVPRRGTENGILRINNKRPLIGSPNVPVLAHLLPDLSKQLFYIGGVPPGFTTGTHKAPGADNPFLGCMRDIQVNGESYDPMESSSSNGVQPSCKNFILKAGFNGDGYIEMHAQSLRKRGNIGFVFRTIQMNCLLIFSAYPPKEVNNYDSKDIRGNFSVSLINGQLKVWLNSGRDFVKMISKTMVNDGNFHVASINKNGRRFELLVDDETQDVKTMIDPPTLISLPRDAGGLYLGGAPFFEEYTALAPTFVGLIGTVQDVVINNRTVNLNEIVSFKNVQIGRNGPALLNISGTTDFPLKTENVIGGSFSSSPKGCIRDVSCGKDALKTFVSGITNTIF